MINSNQNFVGKAPAIFLAHGSPMVIKDDCLAHDFLNGFGGLYHRPKAILLISAHWMTGLAGLTNQIEITSGTHHDTIHDFGGFDPALYQLQYPAKGDPDLAVQIQETLRAAGIDSQLDQNRGLDHGAWIPMMMAYPLADVPILQISIQPRQNTLHHYQLGIALKSLRDSGIMIIASGGLTHNLRAFRNSSVNSQAYDWVIEFNQWIHEKIMLGDIESLLNYRNLHPLAAQNHPSEDHILPFFVALGAGDGISAVKRIHHSYTYGILSMDSYQL